MENEEKKENRLLAGFKADKVHSIFFILKYGFAIALTIYTGVRRGPLFSVIGLLELLCIFCISNRLLRFRYTIFGNILTDVLIAFYNTQMGVLIFGGTYLTLIMLTNIDSAEDLSGQAGMYLGAIALVVIFSCLPLRAVPFPNARIMSLALIAELGLTMVKGPEFSPFYDVYAIAKDYRAKEAQKARLAALNIDPGTFSKGTVGNYYEGTENAGKNVVLILTEGLSQDIVEDDRDIMPNVAKYEKKSLNFTNYYNHTFATYRGIIGQLFSGYQLENLDENHLISIAELLRTNGYYTSFLNSEPNNTQFTTYLEGLGFDDVIGEPGNGYTGPTNSISDKEIYERLFDQMEEQGKGDKPFFTAVYTFGTHLSLDSVDEKFGDGTDPELNKFYNVDCQFGKFMEKFEHSDLKDNTVIVFTADHTTYVDNYYEASFPDVSNRPTDCGRVPLFFYYPGMEPSEIDCEGRNSLDLAPTICNYIQQDGPNFFLGTSLFSQAQNNNTYDRFFSDGSVEYCTANGEVRLLTDSEQKIFDSSVEAYYAIKQSEDVKEQELQKYQK